MPSCYICGRKNASIRFPSNQDSLKQWLGQTDNIQNAFVGDECWFCSYFVIKFKYYDGLNMKIVNTHKYMQLLHHIFKNIFDFFW